MLKDLRDEIAHPCPLCGSAEGRELYRHRGRIVACPRCGLVRRDPIPGADALARVYRSPEYFRLTRPDAIGYGDYYADEPVYRPYFRRKLIALEGFRRPPGRLLEIGCAAGYALDEARARGWDVAGLELSPDAVRFARERFALPVREGGIDEVAPDATWEVIVAFQTIEHLHGLRAALRRLRDALVTDGLLLLTTPDHGSLVRRLTRRFWPSYRPEHLVYFDPRTIRLLLEGEGFRVERVRGDDPLEVPLRRIAERIGHYYLGVRLSAGRFPGWRVPVWLGDMEVTARRLP